MARVSFKRNINIGRTVAKIASTIIALWVGGTIITEIGSVMTDTCSPFYKGLSLIGWTLNDSPGDSTETAITGGCVESTSGAGILAVVGLIGIASIVMEFVQFRI